MSTNVLFTEMETRGARPSLDVSHIDRNWNRRSNFAYGSEGTADTLASLRAADGTNIAGYGLDLVYRGISLYLAANEYIMQEEISFLTGGATTDRQRSFGSYAGNGMLMEEMDAEGSVRSQKVTAGVNVGFPLRRYGIGVSWNYQYFVEKTPADMAAQVEAMATADRINVQREIKRALFGDLNLGAGRGTGNYGYIDRLVDSVHLSVKKLLNADGDPIPPGPNGEIFNGATHNHYMVSSTYWPSSNAVAASTVASTATPTTMNTDVTAMLRNLREHKDGEGEVLVLINAQNESDWYNITGFRPLINTDTIVPGITNDRAKGNLDVNSIGNRMIGVFNGASIWVKPWVPADYMFAFFRTSAEAPLVFRVPKDFNVGTVATNGANAAGSLRVVRTSETHPIYAQMMERQFGTAVWNRWNGVVMFVGNWSGNSATVYTPPSL